MQNIDLKGNYLLSNLLQKHSHNKRIQNEKNEINNGIDLIAGQLQRVNKYEFQLNSKIELLQVELKDKKTRINY